ncbi:hypothetical protein B0H14DRAFT_2635052 [Mycena olivaceomarginata]|nr:hypothetical protein B0H14DRAFT_2635052 [Mycena olivaceomarginata]
MENDLDVGIGRKNQCEGMWWFGEHDMGQEAIRYGKWNESQRPESEVWKLGDRRLEIGGQRPDDRTIRWSYGQTRRGRLDSQTRSQTRRGWTVEPEGGWTVEPEGGWTVEPEGGWTVELEDQRREDLGPNEDDEATTNKRKKSKPEEEGQRELTGEGIKPWK